MAGTFQGSPPWRRTRSASSWLRRASSKTTRLPCRLCAAGVIAHYCRLTAVIAPRTTARPHLRPLPCVGENAPRFLRGAFSFAADDGVDRVGAPVLVSIQVLVQRTNLAQIGDDRL